MPYKIAQILLPLPLESFFDYLIPEGLVLEEGSYVEVPFRNKKLIGVVWKVLEKPTHAKPLKTIATLFDLPLLPEVSRRFIEWVSSYTLSPLGMVLKMVISTPDAFKPQEASLSCALSSAPLKRPLTPKQQLVLEILESQEEGLSVSELAKESGVTSSVVQRLIQQGIVCLVPKMPSLPREPLLEAGQVNLSSSQKAAKDEITRHLKDFTPLLLDGVTGSGKTEVYFEAIAEALKNHRQVLVLLPEITLTSQWLKRFEKRFKVTPHQWHSGLTPKQRRLTWLDIATGKARIIVGARSALFLPYPDLGLIVVDEEHDGSFKQEEGVIYQARDMAIVRARLGNFPIVLVSATPSLESLMNVENGRYVLLHLKDRHAGATLPHIHLIDMRLKRPSSLPLKWISLPLYEALKKNLESDELALLFLNRRGYAPLTLCKSCGHRLLCPNCSVWLVEHRQRQTFDCHHCGYGEPSLKRCPKCQEEDAFVACGPGVERVAEELQTLFPEARLALITSDTVQSPKEMAHLIEQIQDQAIDFLIGTQMIAKGYHFSHLTLVGVIDADLGLSGGDLRAGEKTYQLLHQVAGRAGREERPGEVYLQTYLPEHPVMQTLVSNERDAFLNLEAEEREKLSFPPFGRLAALILAGENLQEVENTALYLTRHLPDTLEIEILGPTPAPLAKIAGKHRWRFLIKGPKEQALQPFIRQWLSQLPISSKVKIQIDIDPYSFL